MWVVYPAGEGLKLSVVTGDGIQGPVCAGASLSPVSMRSS